MKRLGKRDLEPHLPLPIPDGEQERVNHEGCPAGRDGKRRLSIKRDRRDYVLYCHHCGGRGVIRGATGPSLGRAKRKPGAFNPTAHHHWLHPQECWPAEALRWALSYGLTACELEGMAYDPATGRIALPVYDEAALVGYTLRSLEGGGPKYLSRWAPGQARLMLTPCQGGSSDTVVLVEDWLSGRKASRVADTLTLFGTRTPPEAVALVASQGYRWAIIALDDDNPTVRRHQTEAQWALQLVVPEVRVAHLDKDPKEMTTDELKEFIQ